MGTRNGRLLRFGAGAALLPLATVAPFTSRRRRRRDRAAQSARGEVDAYPKKTSASA